MWDLDRHHTLPLAHPNQHPKRHFDRFSRFCTAHDRDRPTDRQTTTRPVITGRIYVRITAMRPIITIELMVGRRSARRIIGMIVASWTMSAVISVPPLFGLEEDAIESSQSTNQSLDDSELRRQQPTSGDPPVYDLPLFEEHDPDAYNDEEFGYRDYYDVMSSAEVSLIYVYEDVNDTLSSETDCIISQNLGYTVFLPGKWEQRRLGLTGRIKQITCRRGQ